MTPEEAPLRNPALADLRHPVRVFVETYGAVGRWSFETDQYGDSRATTEGWKLEVLPGVTLDCRIVIRTSNYYHVIFGDLVSSNRNAPTGPGEEPPGVRAAQLCRLAADSVAELDAKHARLAVGHGNAFPSSALQTA